MATGDYDDDGDLDLAVVHQNTPLALLRNDSRRGHWLKLEFRGRESNRRGIGCRATVQYAGGELVQELCGGTSFASTNQPVMIFGLGEHDARCDVEIRWPNGNTQTLSQIAVDQKYVVEEETAAKPK